MPNLSITKTYADNSVLNEADLDNIVQDIETFLNDTKINNVNIQTNGVITANIADSAVTTDKLNNLAVTTAKLADSAVTNAKLATDAVETDNIVDANVTRAKLEAVGQQESAVVDFSTTSASFTDVGVSETITTSGRPVFLMLSGNNADSTILIDDNNGNGIAQCNIRIRRDGTTTVYQTRLAILNANANIVLVVPLSLVHLDTPTAGTYTYTVEISNGATAGVDTAALEDLQLIVWEL